MEDFTLNSYEIAIISAKAAHDFLQDQKLIDEVIKRLKQEAANLGANGILLGDVGERNTGSSGIVLMPNNSNLGLFISDSSSGKTAQGKAIYVFSVK